MATETINTNGGTIEIVAINENDKGYDEGYRFNVNSPYESQMAETIEAAREIASDMADYLNADDDGDE